MVKHVTGAVGLLVLAGHLPAAVAQVDADLFAHGQQLYEENCAVCHQPGGDGHAPIFPALAGNANLEDLAHVVTTIHEGGEFMPPFDDLAADEVAAVATYVRNAWGNAFGPADPEEVASLLGDMDEAGPRASVWDGIFTTAQAHRGEELYIGYCTRCHGYRLDGAADDPDMVSTPPLARARFLREWDGQSVATLYEYTRATMPSANPGSLSDQQYADILAYMFSVSNMPAGGEELSPDAGTMARIRILATRP